MGPYLKTDDGKKHQVYIITLIDDASRFIVGIDVFFHGNFVNLNILLFPISHRTEFTTTISFKNENIFYRCIENP